MQRVAFLLIGVALGMYMPALPAPLNIINPYLGLILIIIAIYLLIKKK